MDLVSIINFLLIAGVIQGFLFNLVTVFIKKKFSKVIIYLNLTVLFISLNNLQRWLIDKDYTSNIFFIKHLEIPWYVLIFPFFFLFLINFLKVHDKVRDYLKLTIAVFVLELILRTGLILYVQFNIDDLDPSIIKQYTQYEEIVNLVYCLYIFSRALILVFKKQELYSYILSYDDINWIKLFLKISSVVLFFWVIAVAVSYITENRDAYIPLRLGTSIILYWIAYQGFYRYNVVHDRIMLRRSIAANPALVSTSRSFSKDSENNDFINEKHQNEFEKVIDHIITNQRFLDPYLSLEDLADELHMSVSHMSKLINAYSNFNFSDYINSLRVEQAKKLLSDDTFNPYTIVSIGLESGFNSKSTFYSAFKKFTSQTPTTFREIQT